jgi:uncharacterized protein YjbJ (UPF0337 family)
MSAKDKAANEAQNLKGKIKEGVGDATDDESMQAEGKGDQASADLKQRGEQLKDAGKNVKDAFDR